MRNEFEFDIGDCELRIYANGSLSATETIRLTGRIDADDPFTVCHPLVARAACDLNTDRLVFTGNDAIELRCGDRLLDSIGEVGNDPGGFWSGGTGNTTQNHPLRRQCDVLFGDSDSSNAYNTRDWDSFPRDTLDDLGINHCL